MKSSVSLVLIVKNEASVLRRCLDSVVKLVDEIIVVDTGSTDDTKDIATEYGSKVFDYNWNNDFSQARNYALSKATCPWSLVMDADEYISNDCKSALQNFTHQSHAIGKVKMVNKFLGRDGVNFEISYISRLFPSTCRYTGRIHEQIESNLPRNEVGIEIQHDGYYHNTKSGRNIPILKSVIEENPADPYYYYQIAKEYRGLDDHISAFSYLKRAYDLMTHKERYAPNLIVNFLYAIIGSGNLSEGIHVIDKEHEFMGDHSDFFFVSGLFLLELILSDPEKFGNLLPMIERYYQRAIEIGDCNREGSVLGTGTFAAYHNLGVYYEVTGEPLKAKENYEKAARYNYEPSIERLKKP